ncbi:MAG: penicillin-binding transpeptidase domain-containing protein [Ornithinimicrobium sp.]
MRRAEPLTTRPTRSGAATLPLTMVAGLAICLTLGACTSSGPDDPPAGGVASGSAEDLAAELALRFSRHSLDGVPLTDETARTQATDLQSPLADEPVDVEVAKVEEDGDTATAELDWRWNVRGHEWTYTTRASLVRDEQRWELHWRPSVFEPSLRKGDRLGLFTRPARRGTIVGERGTAIVTDRPVLRYGLDKTQVRAARQPRSARAIAAALAVQPSAYVGQVRAAGPDAFVEALVLRTEDALDEVDPAYADIPGAIVVPDTRPLAPTREFAAPVLGRVGPATAEIVEASDGQTQAGDMVGLSGLQQRYENELRGEAGLELVAVAADEQRRRLFTVKPHRGQKLRLTLDPALQEKAETALAPLGENGPPAALVAIRPSTGALLAVANGPGNGGLDVAAAGQYAPGSTFKVVTALALLRAGVSPDATLPCPTTTQVDGRSFKNYDDYPASGIGDITFRSAIANSCNTSLIGARDLLDGDDLTSAAETLGIGPDADLGFPAYFGQVPTPQGETEEAADLIGQGTVLASPLAMAGVAASVAEGRMVTPSLLVDHDQTRAHPDTPLSEAEAASLRDLMRAVVTQGSASFLADVPGEVGAKTGTAEYGEPDASGSLPTHAWMIAFAGDLAVAVFVETGVSGSQTAGPILKEFLS